MDLNFPTIHTRSSTVAPAYLRVHSLSSATCAACHSARYLSTPMTPTMTLRSGSCLSLSAPRSSHASSSASRSAHFPVQSVCPFFFSLARPLCLSARFPFNNHAPSQLALSAPTVCLSVPTCLSVCPFTFYNQPPSQSAWSTPTCFLSAGQSVCPPDHPPTTRAHLPLVLHH
jgi:hypothetical protein